MNAEQGQVGALDNLAPFIQNTLIKQELTRQEVERLCADCVQYGFNAAMVPGAWVPIARSVLSGTGVLVASALDFPPSAMSSASKAAAVAALVAEGAEQIDIGTNVGYLISGMHREYRDDIARAVAAADGVPIKVMLELALLPQPLKTVAVELATDAGSAYLKNASSGSVAAATTDDIRFLRSLAPASVRIKASGAISTAETVRALLAAGADLVGTSHGTSIVTGSPAVDPSVY